MGMQAHEGRRWQWSEEGVGTPGAGLADSHEQPDVGPGN